MILFLQKSPSRNANSPADTFRILKQSITFSTSYFVRIFKFLSNDIAFLAWFRMMMRGKLRPKILSISSAPNAKTYVTYYAKMVYFLKHFLVKVAYSYRESPLT